MWRLTTDTLSVCGPQVLLLIEHSDAMLIHVIQANRSIHQFVLFNHSSCYAYFLLRINRFTSLDSHMAFMVMTLKHEAVEFLQGPKSTTKHSFPSSPKDHIYLANQNKPKISNSGQPALCCKGKVIRSSVFVKHKPRAHKHNAQESRKKDGSSG